MDSVGKVVIREVVALAILEIVVVVTQVGFKPGLFSWHLLYVPFPATAEDLVLLEVLLVGFFLATGAENLLHIFFIAMGVIGFAIVYNLPMNELFPTIESMVACYLALVVSLALSWFSTRLFGGS